MTQPIIKKDIEDRIKDVGDVMTGILHFHNTDGFNSIIKKRIINDVEWNVGFGAGGGGSIGLELQNAELNPDTYTSRVDIYSNKITFIDENKNKYEILHTGNISKQPLTIINDQYYEKNRLYGLDMNNSDIINVNSIYFKDPCDTATEGIHFYAGSGQYNTLWSKDGELLFTPNRTLDDTSGNAYRIITSKGGVINEAIHFDSTINSMIALYENETVTSGTTSGKRNTLLIYGPTYGNTTTDIKIAGKMSWGDPAPQIVFNYSNSISSGQPLALMYSDNNSIGYGTTLSLTSSENTCGFIAPYIKALTAFEGKSINLTDGDILISRTTTIASNTQAKINFKIYQSDNNVESTSFIAVYDDLDAYGYGNNMVVGTYSGLYLCAGEGAISFLANNPASHEYVHVCADNAIYFHTNCNTVSNATSTVYINSAGALYGAVWNDYAEYRDQKEEIKPGYCAAAVNDGRLIKTSYRLQPCDGIVSDTFGFAIGETDNCRTPLAVSGRVLAYFEGSREDYQAGDVVGAGPNGKVIKMTREEIKEYPDRIIGHVSEIPDYKTWGTGNIKVDNRIWIKVK